MATDNDDAVLKPNTSDPTSNDTATPQPPTRPQLDGKSIEVRTKHQLYKDAIQRQNDELVERAEAARLSGLNYARVAFDQDQTNEEADTAANENPYELRKQPNALQGVGDRAREQLTDKARQKFDEKVGSKVKGAIRDKAGGLFKDKAANVAKNAVGDLAKKGGEELAKAGAKKLVAKGTLKAIEAATAATGVGEVLAAAEVAFDALTAAWKRRKEIMAAIGSLIVIMVSLFIVIAGTAFGNPASAGTGPTTPISTTSSVDISALQKALAGGIVPKDVAQSVIDTLPTLRSQLTDALSNSLMNDVEASAQKIIDNANGTNDEEVARRESVILKTKIKHLLATITPEGCGSATYCLDVPGVGQGEGGLCGVTSVTMVVLFYNPNHDDDTFYDREQGYKPADVRVNITNPDASTKCVDPNYIGRKITPSLIASGKLPAGSSQDKWVRKSWASVDGGKDTIIEYMKKSLANGDPMVLYLEPGGIFNPSGRGFGGKHIVTVVGYDANDSADQGGTFIINNPAKFSVKVKTRTATPGNGKKLTAEHIKEYLGGDGSYDYSTSIIVRKKAIE